jgi:putative zinc finger/helix-turn-helix YgiT family protein
MQNQMINFPSSKTRPCDSCGENAVHMSFQDQKFKYGTGDEEVELAIRVPVWTCDQCGDQYTDHVAEELRHAAVCKHLRRLTPREIIDVRKSYDATQAEWSALTGFGIASVKRWESGNLIQNASSDRLIRLLKDRRNFVTLEQLVHVDEAPQQATPKFRTRFSADAPVQASLFSLRRTPELLSA